MTDYKAIYEDMRKRQLEGIRTVGTKSDLNLLLDNDTRRGIALFAFPESFDNKNLKIVREELEQKFDNQVIYYPSIEGDFTYKGLFHNTFMQFIGVKEIIPPEFSSGPVIYVDILRDILFEMGPYNIAYKGIIPISSGLLVTGYPSVDINYYRKQTRKKIKNNNLSFDEPYKTDIVHSTLLRLSGSVDNEKLIEFAEKYKDTDFGTMRVSKMYLGYGSWGMRDHEIDIGFEFDLVEKSVKKL